MIWGSIAIIIIAVIYIANVLGCLILCETIREVKQIRRYVWIIPIMIFLTPLSCIFDTSIKRKDKFILAYVREPHKNITGVYAAAYALEIREKKEQQCDPVYSRSSRRKQRAHVFTDIVENYGAAISTQWAS